MVYIGGTYIPISHIYKYFIMMILRPQDYVSLWTINENDYHQDIPLFTKVNQLVR